VGLLFIWW